MMPCHRPLWRCRRPLMLCRHRLPRSRRPTRRCHRQLTRLIRPRIQRRHCREAVRSQQTAAHRDSASKKRCACTGPPPTANVWSLAGHFGYSGSSAAHRHSHAPTSGDEELNKFKHFNTGTPRFTPSSLAAILESFLSKHTAGAGAWPSQQSQTVDTGTARHACRDTHAECPGAPGDS